MKFTYVLALVVMLSGCSGIVECATDADCEEKNPTVEKY